MSSVHSLPPPAIAELDDLPARAWRRTLEVLDGPGHDGFVDRIQWVSESIQQLSVYRHMECITAEQHVAMLRSLRFRLQNDLGAITSGDAGLSAALLP